jgi:hypothetical protein
MNISIPLVARVRSIDIYRNEVGSKISDSGENLKSRRVIDYVGCSVLSGVWSAS